MHFVTGGAFNGKRAWVKKRYQREMHDHYTWISAYEQTKLPKVLPNKNEGLLILEGVEFWIKQLVTEIADQANCRTEWNRILESWLAYEQVEAQQAIVVIGSDISKGIVPMDETARMWRDVTGWVYQDLVKAADRVDVIWYGIATQLK